MAVVQYLFILRLTKNCVRIGTAVPYALLWTLCVLAAPAFQLTGFSALLQLLIIYVTARGILRASGPVSWFGALLTVCITELAVGTGSSLQVLLLPQFLGSTAFEPLRILTAAATVLLAAGACALACRLFPDSSVQQHQTVLLLIPLLFFCCTHCMPKCPAFLQRR